jgi:MFS transporter, PHS family, inorganic phosphate transporter
VAADAPPTPSPPPGDPTDPRRILSTLDSARVQGFHFRTILVAGMGFFTDAYDLFVISLVIPILVALSPGGTLGTFQIALLGSTALMGAAIGQLLFGWLGDRFGRRKIYVVTLTVMAVGAVGSAFSAPVGGLSTIGVLILWRFVLGVGVGGDYPLSATIMSEYSNVQSRGRLVASVFAMQGFGLLAGAGTSLAVVYAFPSLDLAWRLILGLGAVPAILTIYFRTRLPETPRFDLSRGRVGEAARTVGSITGTPVAPAGTNAPMRISFRQIVRSYGLLIFGTAATWFLLDIAFYSTNIFNPLILKQIGFASAASYPALEQVRRLALGNVLIALVASVPGYWAAVALIDRIGRRPLQFIGFGVMACAFLLLSIGWGSLVAVLPAFLFLYALTFFFANFGPNTTTFVYPSEVFPTAFRTTGHGIAAAAGKVGAVLAVFVFATLYQVYGLAWFFGLLATVSFLGCVLTIALLPETSRRSLEDASGEDELATVVRRFSTYLRSLSLTAQQAAIALRDLLAHPATDRDAQVARIRAIEHAADEEVHRIFVELNNRRLAPEVRAEVGHLASALDDIIDGIESVAARARTYRLDRPRPELVRFADIVVESVERVGDGILGLDELYRGVVDRLDRAIVEVNRLENDADDLLRDLLEVLFTENNAVEILKWKDFYERLEVITDRCEDVTDIFQDLEVRYSPGPVPGRASPILRDGVASDPEGLRGAGTKRASGAGVPSDRRGE